MRFEFTAPIMPLCYLGLASALMAQDTSRTWGFTSARVDSYTAAFVYTGYGYRDAFALGAVMYNQRSGYTELVGGIGGRRSFNGNTHFLVAAFARASDARYVQLYYLPSARVAGVDVEATLEAYLPTERSGAIQYYVTPLSAVRAVSRVIALGASYEYAVERGSPGSHFAGPSVRLTLPRAQVFLDAHLGVQNAPGKARFSYRSFY